ncbi:MAG: response regulator [Terracidiphilus sp.]
MTLGSHNETRVLVVDDERVIADTTAAVFASAGFTSRAVYSAEEALEVVPLWVPHLAVIDVKLPGMSGIDLAIRLKAEYPACKLSLFSGYMDTADMLESAMQAGHLFNMLAKPIHPIELLKLATDLPPALGEA